MGTWKLLEFWENSFFETWKNGTFWNFGKKVFLKNGKIENFGILEKKFFFENWKNGQLLEQKIFFYKKVNITVK